MSNNKYPLAGGDRGEEIGELDLGPFGTLIIKDDGCNDPDCLFELQDADGNKVDEPSRGSGICGYINRFRSEDGDDGLLDALRECNRDPRKPSRRDRTPDPPTAHKCEGDCGRTFPGRRLEREGGQWVCPDCLDDDDS